jgi:NADPH:quinone reductase-like Zn-dependent oxidoreductase
LRAVAETMKAIVQDKYGSPDVLELKEIDKPVVTDNEVLVLVRAASVNALDWHLMRGDPYLMHLTAGLLKPKDSIRGRDVAGQVEAVGKNVKQFRPGDEVFGEVGASLAQYTCVSEELLVLKPANLTFEQAAAVPVAANTALQGLRDRGQIRAHQKVLINGASGGVGTFAVQIAKAFGADVSGVCSTRNVDLVRSIGADHVIDYTQEDFTQSGQRYDLILDVVANRSLSDCRRALTPTGTLVLSGGSGGRWLGPVGLIIHALVRSPFVRQRLRPLTAKPSAENLVVLKEFIESGKITPAIDRTYPLSEAPEAIRYLEGKRASESRHHRVTLVWPTRLAEHRGGDRLPALAGHRVSAARESLGLGMARR